MSIKTVVNAYVSDYVDYGTVTDWYLEFLFQGDGWSFTFTAEEPYIIPKKDWNEFLSSVKAKTEYKISLYCGNGEGSISTKDGNIEFVSMPSGAGGDTYSSFKISGEEVVTKLREALQVPEKEGWCWRS